MNATLLAFAILWEPQVSFHADAVRVGDLVEDLARQSGQSLICSPEVAAEPIVADFDNAPLQDVLEKLAIIAGAEWVTENGSEKLTRPSALLSKQQREEKEKVETAWKRLLDEAVAQVEALPAFDAKEATRTKEFYVGYANSEADYDEQLPHFLTANPTARSSYRLLAKVGASAIAALAVGERAVFSDVPTRAQRPLPANSAEIIQELLRSAQLLRDAQIPRPIYLGLPEIGMGDLSQYGKTLLVIQRNGTLTLRYSIIAVDREGRGILRGSGSLPEITSGVEGAKSDSTRRLDLAGEVMAFAKIATEAGVASASGMRMKLDDGREISVSSWMTHSERDGTAVDRGLGKFLSDPVIYDPVGLYFGKLIRQIGKSENKWILATLADGSLFDLAREIAFGNLRTHGDFIEFLTQRSDSKFARAPYVEMLREENWLIVVPYLPVNARAQRFNRVAARELIRAIQAKQVATADDGVRYVSKTPSVPGIRSIDKILISHATPTVDRTSIDLVLYTPADFFSALGEIRWREFIGQTVTYSQLSPSLRQIVDRWVFWSGTLEREAQVSVGFRDGEFSIEFEPTELFPNGVPPDTKIVVESSELPAVIARSDSGHIFNMSVYSWAFSAVDGGSRTFDAFRLATERTYTVRVLLPDGFVETRTMVETVPHAPPPGIPFHQLPSDFVKMFEDARARFRGGSQ